MPRYIVQRTFPDGLQIPVNAGGADICRGRDRAQRPGGRHLDQLVRQRGQDPHVLRLRRAHPEAIRRTADRNALPVDEITQVRVFDPYFYA